MAKSSVSCLCLNWEIKFIYLLNFGFVSKKDVIIEKLFDFMVLI